MLKDWVEISSKIQLGSAQTLLCHSFYTAISCVIGCNWSCYPIITTSMGRTSKVLPYDLMQSYIHKCMQFQKFCRGNQVLTHIYIKTFCNHFLYFPLNRIYTCVTYSDCKQVIAIIFTIIHSLIRYFFTNRVLRKCYATQYHQSSYIPTHYSAQPSAFFLFVHSSKLFVDY